MRLTRAGLAAACLAALAGCAALRPSGDEVPFLRLAPAALGRPLSLQQQLTLRVAGREQQMEVLLEADPARVKLAVVALGQLAARIEWDGTTLSEWHSPWWPPAVSGERILGDMQLSLWPLAAVQSALPAGWQASEDGGTRTLSRDGAPVVVVRHPSAGVVELDQRRDHYQLTIVSQAAAAAAAP